MTSDNPIPSADEADVVEQSIPVDDDSDDYPTTNRDRVDDESDAIAPVHGSQRH